MQLNAKLSHQVPWSRAIPLPVQLDHVKDQAA